MPLAAQGLRIARGVRWREFADGVVVYVGETCETHLLPPDWSSLLEALSTGMDSDDAGNSGGADLGNARHTALTEFSDSVLRELADLKIFDRVN